ncbi:MAG: hypothetical protein Q8R69_08955 [Telluria sp.]|nr:hypothetical protein [Telluria sp.]
MTTFAYGRVSTRANSAWKTKSSLAAKYKSLKETRGHPLIDEAKETRGHPLIDEAQSTLEPA